MPMPASSLHNSRIVVVPLTHKLLVQTDGTTAGDVILDISCPQVESWGPHIQAITPHTLLEQKSANFQWRVVMYTSLDGINWAVAGNLFTASTATTAAGVVQADFTDKTKIGLHIRFSIVCSPVTGTARESGVVTVALAFDFRT